MKGYSFCRKNLTDLSTNYTIKNPEESPGLFLFHLNKYSLLFYFFNDCFERFRLVHG
jgi:hypothetical protein